MCYDPLRFSLSFSDLFTHTFIQFCIKKHRGWLVARPCPNTPNHLSIDPSIHRSIHPSIHPSIDPSIHLCIHPSIYPPPLNQALFRRLLVHRTSEVFGIGVLKLLFFEFCSWFWHLRGFFKSISSWFFRVRVEVLGIDILKLLLD